MLEGLVRVMGPEIMLADRAAEHQPQAAASLERSGKLLSLSAIIASRALPPTYSVPAKMLILRD